MAANTLIDADQNEAGSPLDELLTSRQVGALLQLRISTVEDYARRGILPSLKLGRHRRYLRSQVEHTITTLSAKGSDRGR
jgi:hypothetical protein